MIWKNGITFFILHLQNTELYQNLQFFKIYKNILVWNTFFHLYEKLISKNCFRLFPPHLLKLFFSKHILEEKKTQTMIKQFLFLSTTTALGFFGSAELAARMVVLLVQTEEGCFLTRCMLDHLDKGGGMSDTCFNWKNALTCIVKDCFIKH